MSEVVVVRPHHKTGDDAFRSSIAERDRIDRARAVAVVLDEPVDTHVFAMCLHAIGTGKLVVVAASDSVLSAHPELWMIWRSAPFFSSCDQQELVFIASKMAEHGMGAAHGGPFGFAWARELAKCESPIEERLLLHVLSACRADFQITAQREVVSGGNRYRLDIALIEEPFESMAGFKIAIECDGHDFHERTKDQARRDRSRDRAMTLDGWVVMRFTGSEIWKDAAACGEQVRQMASKLRDAE